MPLMRQKRIYREDLQANRQVLYIFGDNRARRGMGGQAGEMRGEQNAVGIATLDANIQPYKDSDWIHNIVTMYEDFLPVREALKKGKVVVFPADGIGTGIADMPHSAPLTFSWLEAYIRWLTMIYGV